MRSLINTKELCKQIKLNSKRGAVIWSREADSHFITNRHFLAHFEELPNDVLAALFGVFYKIVEVGQTFSFVGGQVDKNPKHIKYDGIFRPNEQNVTGNITEYIRESSKKFTSRVVKFPTHYSFISSEYMKLVEFDDLSPTTSGNSSAAPVYFADKNLILLPYRFSNDKILIEELLGSEDE